jgi:hypothetical protein
MATAAALTLPLWLGSCTPGFDPSASRSVPAGATTIERADPNQAPLVPIPQPQAPPPAAAAAPEASSPSAPASPGPRGPASTPGAAAAPGSSGLSGTHQAVGTSPSPTPEPSAAPPETPAGQAAGTQTVTAYYVLVDDGGAGGVRFGCNDSLAGIRRSVPGSTEPLAAAMRALLDGSATPAGLYNALSGSSLTFLSGTTDGSTVTAYLSGSMRPGGVCDIPRIEAQLTQTAIASVGAIRAEVYINGVGLTEALSLK